MTEDSFKVGCVYENRKGKYTVLSVCGDRMTIRWENGEEVETDVAGQLRVLRHMQQERHIEETKQHSRQLFRKSLARAEALESLRWRLAQLITWCEETGDEAEIARAVIDVLDEPEAKNPLTGAVDSDLLSLLEEVPVAVKIQPPLFARLPRVEQVRVVRLNRQARISEIVKRCSADGNNEGAARGIAEILLEQRSDSLFSTDNDDVLVRLLEDVPVNLKRAPLLRPVLPRRERIRMTWLDRGLSIAEALARHAQGKDERAVAQGIAQVIVEAARDAPADRQTAAVFGFSIEDLLTEVPANIKAQPDIFSSLATDEQFEVAWVHYDTMPSTTWQELQNEDRISLVFRAASERRSSGFLPDPQQEHPLVQSAMLLLQTANVSQEEKFKQSHACLESWVLGQAWKSDEALDGLNLFPRCESGLRPVKYCEGRRWITRDSEGNERDSVYCPRTKRPCNEARVEPDVDREWRRWSLLELISATETEPSLPLLSDPGRYVPQMCGWINRLNEIRENLKCSQCHEVMVPNRQYAKFLAKFQMTVVKCRHGGDHDAGIYLNQCWACGRLIDSRESRFQEAGHYYVCIQCGSGPEQSDTYTQGDMCPMCGVREPLEPLGESRKRRCGHCEHVIALPHPEKMTGLESRKEQQMEEWLEPF